MTDKQMIIDGVDVSECNFCEWKSSDIHQCRIRLASFESTCKGYNCHYKQLKHKEQECERLKWYLKEIRDDELKTLDVELDEYETHCIDTEYSNVINLVEEALEEISPEDCRYKKDK